MALLDYGQRVTQSSAVLRNLPVDRMRHPGAYRAHTAANSLLGRHSKPCPARETSGLLFTAGELCAVVCPFAPG